MKSFSIFALLVISLANVSLAHIPLAHNGLPEGRHISVTGTAELTTKPDIAILAFSVEAVKSKSIDAKKDVDERVNRLLAGLSKFKIDEDNISASNLYTQPHYSYHNRQKELDGYLAKRTLKVTLNDITLLNDLMDFTLKVGINTIADIHFTSANAKVLRNEVNALAVKNAKEKANSLAHAFDAKVSDIYSINSISNKSRDRFGSNSAIESIKIRGASASFSKSTGKYLQENIVFSAAIRVVFDLDVK